jgi:CYTH domain-containing protein
MTTLYLDPAEEPLLQSLPGSRSVKRRYELRDQGHTFCIDLYEEPAAARGTLVAEVECDTDAELERITIPAWARREVTEDGAYSGFRLAD